MIILGEVCFFNTFSAKGRVQVIILNQIKLKVNDTYKKITQNLKP